MRTASSNSYQALATEDWLGMITVRTRRPSKRSAFTALNDCERLKNCTPPACIPASGARCHPLTAASREGANRRTVAFWTHPHLTLEPQLKRARLMDLGMARRHAVEHR